MTEVSQADLVGFFAAGGIPTGIVEDTVPHGEERPEPVQPRPPIAPPPPMPTGNKYLVPLALGLVTLFMYR